MHLRTVGGMVLLVSLPWLAACAAPPQTTEDGAVEVVFTQLQRYRDAGITPTRAQANPAALRAFLLR
jgi:hypothetical protein